MTYTDKQVLLSLLRTEFFSFVCKVFEELNGNKRLTAGEYLQVMCLMLEQCTNGDIKRLLITIPPRYLKSITVSVALTAWILGHFPDKKIIVASYGADLATEHTLAFRQVLESAWYRELFPHTKIRAGVSRITVQPDALDIVINLPEMIAYLNDTLHLTIPAAKQKDFTIATPFTTRRSYKGAIILKPETDDTDPFDLPPQQLRNLVRGIVWRDEHFAGISMKEIADREGLTKGGVRKIIMASFDTLMAA
ncbi:MAG: hypothetical protein H6868_02885 [Rhodospirillales bacterium]|nr:hypothetical protein [Rhodospirillales bacterium]